MMFALRLDDELGGYGFNLTRIHTTKKKYKLFFQFPGLGKGQTSTVRRAEKDGAHDTGPESPKP